MQISIYIYKHLYKDFRIPQLKCEGVKVQTCMMDGPFIDNMSLPEKKLLYAHYTY